MASQANSTYVAIMAGGVGSRFWPASRTTRPKQFLDILGVGKSLLRLTFERFLKLCPVERIFIVTNRQYRELVLEILPELDAGQVLCEPSRNNTAPCIAYAAFKINAIDPEANLVVAPSDHIILDEAAFLNTVRTGLNFTAQREALLTLGIRPTRPDTGYGYIRFEKQEASPGIHPVARFTEKPDKERAAAFLASGDHLWNAGIFIWRTATVLRAFQRHAGAIFEILGCEPGVYNTNGEQEFIDRQYPLTPNISVDFAIMEKASDVFVMPSSFGWSDLGTWASLYEESSKDAGGNVVQGKNVLLQDVSGSLIRVPPGKIAVIRGLEDYIVVDEGDILVIYPKSEEQEIRQVTEDIRRRFGTEYT